MSCAVRCSLSVDVFYTDGEVSVLVYLTGLLLLKLRLLTRNGIT
jgi:hypothetical protein